MFAPVKKAKGSLRGRVATVAALALSAAVIPSVLAAPAQASENKTAQTSTVAASHSIQSNSTCSLTAQTPYWYWAWESNRYVKKVNYKISVYCFEGTYLNINQNRYEYDMYGTDYRLGSSTWGSVWIPANKLYTFDSVHYALNTEAGDEEDFHRVTFREWHGAWSPSKTLTSHYASIPV
ncbi:hypothetical protein [Arthrobacter sp. SAFR-014]|uniref:hypothetical protein n=1 Tax=unclassified Arthrobacter TaxID=235627 RepID=UPI003F7CABA8